MLLIRLAFSYVVVRGFSRFFGGNCSLDVAKQSILTCPIIDRVPDQFSILGASKGPLGILVSNLV
jgi:hypothetical protein